MTVERTYVDAVVVGAGIGGIYSTYRLSRMNLSVKCIDRAGGVGGTWYWNRYPGAMSDTETYLYRYSWDKEDLQTYPWSTRYVYQPEILKYLQHVVARHDLEKYMEFNVDMRSAVWDETLQRWRIVCSTGATYLCRYFISALGILSKANFPDVPGVDDFQGHLVHTSDWPRDLDLAGKRVGIIGNGSTGVQVITAIAPEVSHLISFQRHPQYTVPSGQGPVTTGYREEVNANYDKIWDNVFSSFIGFNVPEVSRNTFDFSTEQRREIYQDAWDKGNAFRFMFSTFGDVTTNEDANEEACNFIRGKIDEIVKDPKTASILKPKEPYARRPICDTGYYETFNRDNVQLVDLQKTPITRIVPTGLQTSDGTTHAMDALIFATGFDVFEGSYLRVEITGRNGETMKQHWQHGPTAYGAIACAGFPNMFIISGPQGPFANFPPVIESEINFAMSCIEHAEKTFTTMEISPEGEAAWGNICTSLTEGSIFKKTPSWIFGVNIPGRLPTTNFYFGGLGKYLEWVKGVVDGGFQDFRKISAKI